MNERITVNLDRDRYALNKLMSEERVVRVHLDGTVSHPKNVTAPKVNCGTDGDGQILDVHDKAMVEDLKRQGWSVMTGWTGQYSYSGPIMHTSEFVGGHLALEILDTDDKDTPVDYVALAVDVDSEVCPNESPTCVLSDPCVLCHDGRGAQREREIAGWLIAYREVSGS